MKTIKALVFDLYGTLFDVHSVMSLCEEKYPGQGEAISILWRQKQLEYTWMRALMGQYMDFEHATHAALRYTCNHLGLKLEDDGSKLLCDAYLAIDPYPEVPAALTKLKSLGLQLAILSNGSTNSITKVVENAGLSDRFDALISVDKVRIFKPHPTVYQLAVDDLGVAKEHILFVSSNSWDATGAAYFGFQVCWINRGGRVFDELGRIPEFTASGIDDLARQVAEARGA